MNPNDPDVIALSKAIFQHESGGDFNAVGDAGTSHGAGQWQAPTWKAQAHDVLGDENAPMTPGNQKAVIQVSIAKDKASGLNPAQIAAKWNSGHPDGWENKIGTTTINGQQIHYDVPAYVKAVTDLYQQNKGQSGKGAYNPNPFSNPNPGEFDFTGNTSGAESNQPKDDSLTGHLKTRMQDASTALGNAASGKINPISGVLQTVGAGAGAIGDTVSAGLGLIPGVKQAENAVGGVLGKLAQTKTGQAISGGVNSFSQAHPELAGDIGAVGNIASVLPIGKVAGLAKDAAASGIAKAGGKGSLDATIEAVSPNLSSAAMAKKIAKQGVSKSPISGKIAPLSGANEHTIARVVADHVPNFDKLKTFAEKMNATRDAVTSMAENLKQDVINSGKDIIYPFKELAAKMNAVEEPISLKGTPFEKQIKPIKAAALEIAQKNGGTISSLFDARKEFDQLVEKTYPNLWDKENAPMRTAISSIRNTMNDFIEEHLPAGNGFKDSLRTQSHLFRAIDNLAPKAVKEIGTTRASRFAGRHPVISGVLKTAGRAVGQGAGAGAVMNHL